MGGMQSLQCDRSTNKEIWLWYMQREISISASHMPWKSNILADKASGKFHYNTEWILRPDLFWSIAQRWGTPDIDLFASRLNACAMFPGNQTQGPALNVFFCYAIPWTDHFFYAFHAFSIILRCVEKIEQEEAEGMLVVPNWPTQPWYTKVKQMITDYARL